METMTETGTEKRVGELSNRIGDLRGEMHRGFDRVEADVRELRSDMKAGLDSLNERMDSLHRLMIRFSATTLGSVVAAAIVMVLAQH